MAESPADRIKRLIAERSKTPAKTEVVKAENEVIEIKTESKELIVQVPAQVLDPTVTLSQEPIHMMLAELETALLAKRSDFHVVLRDIHRHLANDPNVVTILKDEEIALIVKGLETHGQLTIIEPKAASGRGKSKTQPITSDML